ncbi:MAG: excisionase family DNA-binding protein [Thermoleophilia bacterium]|nr:excisionase family DNA-binding protein [Thermoleophilia bacterium]
MRQVAECLDLHYCTIWQMVRDGRLEAIRIGRSVRIPASAVATLEGKYGTGRHDS